MKTKQRRQHLGRLHFIFRMKGLGPLVIIALYLIILGEASMLCSQYSFSLMAFRIP